MANNVIKRIWNQNKMVNIEALQGMAFQAEDGGHTFVISGVDDTGAAVALSGTVAGVFRRPDNADIALTGAASGGVASVTLTDDCYAVPGRFGLTIFVTSGGQKVAVYACVGTVASTNGGAVAGSTPQDVVDLINAISAAVATIPASYTDLMAAIAPIYSNSALYAVGSYSWHDGDLYRCNTPITTAETWTAAHWTAAVIGNDVSDLKSAITQETGGAVFDNFQSGYIATNGSTVDISTVQPSSTGLTYQVIDASPKDKFTITGKGGSTGRLWCFVGAESNGVRPVLSVENASETREEYEITAPSNTEKLIVNVNTNNPALIIKGRMLVKKVDSIYFNSSFDVISEYGTRRDRTHNGITYTWDGETCAVSGTASSVSFCNLLNNSSALPGILKIGDVLQFTIQRTSTNINAQLFWYINGSMDSGTYLTGNQEIKIPQDATGLLLRLFVSSGTAFGTAQSITVKLLYGETNQALSTEVYNARESYNGTKYGSLKTHIQTFEETALKHISITESQAASLYNNDIANIPPQTYALIIPSWFNIDVPYSYNAHWLFKYVQGETPTYKLIDITSHREYMGYLHSNAITWTRNITGYLTKNVANFGDSLTWGRDGSGSASTKTAYTISAALNRMYDVNAINYGVGGMGYFSKGGGMTAIEKLQDTDISSYDVITLGFGSNDNTAELGTINDTDGTTMLGAMYVCWQYIRTQNPTCTVIFIAPPNASTFGNKANGYWYGYKRGPLSAYNLKQLVDGMRDFCAKYHIPFIDNLDSFDNENISILLPDGVHPNDTGYKAYSIYIARRIGLYL